MKNALLKGLTAGIAAALVASATACSADKTPAKDAPAAEICTKIDQKEIKDLTSDVAKRASGQDIYGCLQPGGTFVPEASGWTQFPEGALATLAAKDGPALPLKAEAGNPYGVAVGETCSATGTIIFFYEDAWWEARLVACNAA